MRAYILLTVLLNLGLLTFAQTDMETDCAKTIKLSSEKQIFSKFTGQLSFSEDSIKYDSSLIIIRNTKNELIDIFKQGLLFPNLIYGASTHGDKFEIIISKNADTLTISDVTELNIPNQNPGSKTFSFLRWQKHFANPSLYIFELTNKNSNSKTPIGTFIKNARITSFGFCSILM
jgi:hypothetical protein